MGLMMVYLICLDFYFGVPAVMYILGKFRDRVTYIFWRNAFAACQCEVLQRTHDAFYT